MSIFQSNWRRNPDDRRSEEHTSELQSHLNSYAVFCLRSEEHTSELQSHLNLVCRLLLEKKKTEQKTIQNHALQLRSSGTSASRVISHGHYPSHIRCSQF